MDCEKQIQTFYSNGAMYAEANYFKIAKTSVKLGDGILRPRDLVSKLGEKKRSNFEMQDNCYLEYIGRCKDGDGILLLFKPYPRETLIPKRIDLYYCFCYIDRNTLLIMGHKGGYDIRIDSLKTFSTEDVKVSVDPPSLNKEEEFLDLKWNYATHKALKTEIDHRKYNYEYHSEVVTKLGTVPIDEWKRKAYDLIKKHSEEEIFLRLKDYIVKEVSWCRKKEEIEVYALQLHIARIFEDAEWEGYDKFNESIDEKAILERKIRKRVAESGSNFSGGGERIKAIVNSHMERKDKVKALKEEYGLGGGTFIVDDFDGWIEYDPPKGVRVKDKEWKVVLSFTWTKLLELMEETYLLSEEI